MTRKKLKRKETRRRESDKKLNDANEEKIEGKCVAISSLFKSDELQEIKNILQISELGDEHTLVGAVVLGKFDVVKKLLRDGVPIDCASGGGLTALMWAIKVKQMEMVELLVRRGASLHQEDNEGNNVILHALQASTWDQDTFIDFWNQLKETDVDLNHANRSGNTALHHAVKRQWANTLELLLDAGANVNSVTNKGVTALMMASSKHHSRLVEILLNHSADYSIEDQRGCTALCYAIAYMIQKRLRKPDCVLDTLVGLLNSNSKLSTDTYLKRRLELITNPPEDNFIHTLTTVIVHVVTYFMRFIENGATSFIEIEVFKKLKEAMDKHMEDNQYMIGLLSILIELLRHCDCCMQHVTKEYVFNAFVEADIPNTFLRILKRCGTFSSSSSIVQPMFLPMALACSHGRIKSWLQQNFNQYLLYSKRNTGSTQQPVYNYYPDEKHSQMVRRSSLELKALLARLQKGDTIFIEKTKPVKRKMKERDMGHFKEETTSNPDLKDNREISNESINNTGVNVKKVLEKDSPEETVKKTSSKEKLEEQSSTEEFETYWSLKKVEEEEQREEEKETTQPKKRPAWQEELREGCELFGITDEEPEEPEQPKDPVWVDLLAREDLGQGDTFRTREELEAYLGKLELEFTDIALKYEEAWRNDFDRGYPQANAKPKDIVKLMRILPELEMNYLRTLTAKWRIMIDQVRLCWQEHRNDRKLPMEDIEKELNLLSEQLKNRNEGSEDGGEYNKEDEGTGLRELRMMSGDAGDVILCRAEKEYEPPLLPPPGFEHRTSKINPNKTIPMKRDRLNLYMSPQHSDMVKRLRELPLEQCQVLAEDDLIMAAEEHQPAYRISQGGNFGTVVIGLDLGSYPVAVKQVAMSGSMSSQMVAMRLKELLCSGEEQSDNGSGHAALLSIANQHIVPYTHCADLGYRLLFATPLCQTNLGQHLATLKHNGLFTEEAAFNMVRQILLGLHFLHSQRVPIVHGNIKPSNVLVDAKNNLRLAEFGLHKLLYQQTAPTAMTLIWWSHETYSHYQNTLQVLGTRESDVQACGMVVHYAATGGLHPFGKTSAEIIAGIARGYPRLATSQPEATDLMAWMLMHDPRLRPTLHQAIRHVFLWEPAKKWKFVLVCAGVPLGDSPLSFRIDEFHHYLDYYASAQKIHTTWVNAVKVELSGMLRGDLEHYPDNLGGLLKLVRENLPSSGSWFLRLFPCVPLTLFRLLEDTPWMSHRDFQPFAKLPAF